MVSENVNNVGDDGVVDDWVSDGDGFDGGIVVGGENLEVVDGCGVFDGVYGVFDYMV